MNFFIEKKIFLKQEMTSQQYTKIYVYFQKLFPKATAIWKYNTISLQSGQSSFSLGGKNSPPQFFNIRSCYHPAILVSDFGKNSPPQLFNGKSCYYPAISISALGKNSPP